MERENSMVRFKFTVNKSFLQSTYRYITVPKRQVDYTVFEREGLNSDNLTIICPCGKIMSGNMYSGVAGYGPYYQIRAYGYDNDPLSSLHIGQPLIIEIEKNGKIVQVKLIIE